MSHTLEPATSPGHPFHRRNGSFPRANPCTRPMSSAGSPADRSEAVAPLLDYHAIAETNFSSPQDIVVADERAGEPSARRIEQSQYRPWQRGGPHSALAVLHPPEKILCPRALLGGPTLSAPTENQPRPR